MNHLILISDTSTVFFLHKFCQCKSGFVTNKSRDGFLHSNLIFSFSINFVLWQKDATHLYIILAIGAMQCIKKETKLQNRNQYVRDCNSMQRICKLNDISPKRTTQSQKVFKDQPCKSSSTNRNIIFIVIKLFAVLFRCHQRYYR